MLPQIKRLLFFFIIFIIIFITIKKILTKETYGDIGRYRANSLIDNEKKPTKFAGNEICSYCHEDMVTLLETDLHAGISCETCHGPALQHTINPDSIKPFKPHVREFCGTCHSVNAAKNPKMVTQVDLNQHNTGKECIECHNSHIPWELKEEQTDENL